jgi:hypothetical protein
MISFCFILFYRTYIGVSVLSTEAGLLTLLESIQTKNNTQLRLNDKIQNKISEGIAHSGEAENRDSEGGSGRGSGRGSGDPDCESSEIDNGSYWENGDLNNDKNYDDYSNNSDTTDKFTSNNSVSNNNDNNGSNNNHGNENSDKVNNNIINSIAQNHDISYHPSSEKNENTTYKTNLSKIECQEERKKKKETYKKKQQTQKNCKNGKSDDFRIGGLLDRTRGKKSGFNMKQVRGLYDDDEEEGEEESEEESEGGGKEGGGEGERDGGEGIKYDEGGVGGGGLKRVITKVRRNGIIYFIPRSTGIAPSPEEKGLGNRMENNCIHIDENSQVVPYSATNQYEEGRRQGEKEGEEEIPGLGFLSYVVDGRDGTMRACALRTIVVRRRNSCLSICLSLCLSLCLSVCQ